MSLKTEREAEKEYRAMMVRLFREQPVATAREMVSYLVDMMSNFWGLT